MNIIDAETLAQITGREINDNARSALAGISRRGFVTGFQYRHRLAQFLAQVGHESMGFVYDQEVWGPTPAQARYDTRTDLGNTPERDGDGHKYRGRGPIQITGRYNYQIFTDWCWSFAPEAPNFVAEPDRINTDPWEGLVALWYWEARNLNRYADVGDIEMVTKKINGGLNGYQDRLRWYTRAALVFLGFEAEDVAGFQAGAGLQVDGIAGPRTRTSLHQHLRRLPPIRQPVPAPATRGLLALIRAILRAFTRRST